MDKKTSIIILVILAVLGTAYHFLWSGNDGPEAEPQSLVEPDLRAFRRLPRSVSTNDGVSARVTIKQREAFILISV